MRLHTIRTLRMAAVALALVACDAGTLMGPKPAALSPTSALALLAPTGPGDVRISEFHYDNPGTDANEFIEISGPANTSLTGWQVVRYNGATPGAAKKYTTGGDPVMTGLVIPQSCGTRGAVRLSYAVNGLENGGNDGFALIDPTGKVIEYLTYEGVATAADGPAAGVTSVDVGVFESGLAGSDPNTSIKRVYDAATGNFSWVVSSPPNPGVCNDDNSGSVQPAAALQITPGTEQVTVGSTKSLTAKATDANGNDVTGTSGVTWTSSDPTIATVSTSGAVATVTGVAPGSVTITASTNNNITATATLTVVPKPVVVSIALTPSNETVFTGSTQQYTAVAKSADSTVITSSTTFTWSASDPTVVSINATGLATGLKIGTVTITVTSANGTTATATLKDVDPPSVNLPAVRFSEIHYDNSGTDANEAIEIEAPLGTSLAGYNIVLYDGGTSSTTGLTGAMYSTTPVIGTLAGACNGRGVVAIHYPVNGIQNGSPDGFALVDPQGSVVEFLSYEGSFTAFDGPAAGLVSTNIGVEEGSSTTATQSLSRQPNGIWSAPANNTMGVPNACANGTSNQPTLSISTSGPDSLVLGWQRRGFVTYFDANGNSAALPGPITWTSETPAIVSVDALGYATALTPGDGIVRATVGTATNTYHVQAIEYQPVTATYHNHVLFGVPTSATDPNLNAILLNKVGSISSYNPTRGGPNWVSWNINATTFGNADRCECFSGDASLPADVSKITDQDYVGGGYDRGHMVQSESRTSNFSENAATFLMTNILPQAPHNNQGIWSGFENFTNDLARVSGKDVYVIAGGEYAANPTTLKGAGRVAIPDYTWKVVVAIAPGTNPETITSVDQLQVYAVRMPNLIATAPTSNDKDYSAYVTTVDEIQKHTGLDLLSALPDNIERAVELNDKPPVATFATSATTVNEGGSIAFDAGASTDADDAILGYSWNFGDGAGAGGVNATHTYAESGTYTVTLIVTDVRGVYSTATSTVTVNNVPPTATFTAPNTVTEGSPISLALANATDISPVDQASLSFAFACSATDDWHASATPTYACPTVDNATLTVRGKVMDHDGGATEYSHAVTVTNVAPTATMVAPSTVVEGTAIAFSLASVIDPSSVDQATLAYAYACSATGDLQASASASFSCPTTDNGTVTVRARVSDKDGGASEYSQAVLVTNAAPVIGGFATSAVPVAAGVATTATLTYTDAGSADTHTAVFVWGDGTTSTVNGASGQAIGTHVYATGGFYTVSVTLRDDDGGTAAATSPSLLIVYDQNAGGVKAEGWFAGANGGQGSDKLHYNLDASYSAGGQVTGQLTLTSPYVSFRSSSIELLVVSGAIGTMTGTGTTADGTAVSFVVAVREGAKAGDKQNRIRMQIRNSATGMVLYDTNPGAPTYAAPTLATGGGDVKVGR